MQLLTDVDTITGYSFDFDSRVFNGTGSSITDMCQDGTNIQADIDYFLARKSSLFLTTAGEFKVVDGAPAEIDLHLILNHLTMQ